MFLLNSTSSWFSLCLPISLSLSLSLYLSLSFVLSIRPQKCQIMLIEYDASKLNGLSWLIDCQCVLIFDMRLIKFYSWWLIKDAVRRKLESHMANLPMTLNLQSIGKRLGLVEIMVIFQNYETNAKLPQLQHFLSKVQQRVLHLRQKMLPLLGFFCASNATSKT